MLSLTRTKFNDVAPILAHFLDELCTLQQWRNKFKDSMTIQYKPFIQIIHPCSTTQTRKNNHGILRQCKLVFTRGDDFPAVVFAIKSPQCNL